jgi:hypothetical protein
VIRLGAMPACVTRVTNGKIQSDRPPVALVLPLRERTVFYVQLRNLYGSRTICHPHSDKRATRQTFEASFEARQAAGGNIGTAGCKAQLA